VFERQKRMWTDMFQKTLGVVSGTAMDGGGFRGGSEALWAAYEKDEGRVAEDISSLPYYVQELPRNDGEMPPMEEEPVLPPNDDDDDDDEEEEPVLPPDDDDDDFGTSFAPDTSYMDEHADTIQRGTIVDIELPSDITIHDHLAGRPIPKSVPAYISPPVQNFYKKPNGSPVEQGTIYHRNGTHFLTKASSQEQNDGKLMTFNGFQGKFINMGPETVQLFWHGNGQSYPMAVIDGWQSSGTATFPGHHFFLVKHGKRDIKDALVHFHMNHENQVEYYDPIREDPARLSQLTKEERDMYTLHLANRQFAQIYKKTTNRNWLSMFPRMPPKHFMYRADHIGQIYHVPTPQTHFIQHPPPNLLTQLDRREYDRLIAQNLQVNLPDYRAPTLNLTLKVLSAEPRAFEIQDFLSPVEVEHLFTLVTGQDLHASTVSGDNHNAGDVPKTKTRTSRNTWIYRETSPIVDAIYRRAADVLRIDELKLRRRTKGEHDDLPTRNPICEALQFVHYAPGQEYTAHHDFGYGNARSPQNHARFATLLLYLNGPPQGLRGGHTTFPRWKNLETREPLKVTPKLGQAVLFYSFMEDGNMDDLSQHSAAPVITGEKWLANLWIWEPYQDDGDM